MKTSKVFSKIITLHTALKKLLCKTFSAFFLNIRLQNYTNTTCRSQSSLFFSENSLFKAIIPEQCPKVLKTISRLKKLRKKVRPIFAQAYQIGGNFSYSNLFTNLHLIMAKLMSSFIFTACQCFLKSAVVPKSQEHETCHIFKSQNDMQFLLNPVRPQPHCQPTRNLHTNSFTRCKSQLKSNKVLNYERFSFQKGLTINVKILLLNFDLYFNILKRII